MTDSGSFSTMDSKNAAAGLPTKTWDCNHTGIVWLVKWVNRGLTPQRPFVVLMSDMTIDPQKAISLS